MSDPLSVAGSVVGIISLGLQVATQLHDYYTKYKSQDDDIRSLLLKIDRLSVCLSKLKDIVDKRPHTIDEEKMRTTVVATVAQCETSLDDLSEELKRFDKEILKGFKGMRADFKHTTRRVLYPLRKSTIQRLEEDLDSTIDDLTVILQLYQQSDMQNVKEDVAKANALLQVMKADQVETSVKNWLDAPDATSNLNINSKKHQPGTGTWFLKSEQFQKWLRDPGTALWLQGFAGCGKSVLSSLVIRETMRHCSDNPNTALGFFFFTFTDGGKQDVSSMLRALVLQLASQSGANHSILTDFYQANESRQPSDEELLDILRNLIAKFSDVYIILDALDESPVETHRTELLDMLVEMNNGSIKQMHFLATSRPEVDISRALDCIEHEQIQLRNEAIDDDIGHYVSEQLRNSRALRKWAHHRERIETTLSKKALGVFRWAECQLKALQACPCTEYHLDQQLQSLPKTLDETYAQMLDRIPEVSKEFARRILVMLSCSAEPLTAVSVMEGLAIELGNPPTCNPSRRPVHHETLLEVCPGLIEIYEVDKHVLEVRIAHFSVEEFLKSTRILETPGAAFFHIEHTSSHTEMTRVCLSILISAPGDRSSCPNASRCCSSVREHFHLASYSSGWWKWHFTRCASSAEAIDAVLRFLQHGLEDDFVGLPRNPSVSPWGDERFSQHLAYPHRHVDDALAESVLVDAQHAVRELSSFASRTTRLPPIARTNEPDNFDRAKDLEKRQRRQINVFARAVSYDLPQVLVVLSCADFESCDAVDLLYHMVYRTVSKNTVRVVLENVLKLSVITNELRALALRLAVKFRLHDLILRFLPSQSGRLDLSSHSESCDCWDHRSDLETLEDRFSNVRNPPPPGFSVILWLHFRDTLWRAGCSNGDLQSLKILLAHDTLLNGAEKYAVSGFLSALHGALFTLRNQDDEVVRYLIELAPDSIRNLIPDLKDIEYIFCNLVSCGAEELCRLFIESGVCSLSILESALSSAVRASNVELARYLLESGALLDGESARTSEENGVAHSSSQNTGSERGSVRSRGYPITDWWMSDAMLDLLSEYRARTPCTNLEDMIYFALQAKTIGPRCIRSIKLAIELGADVNLKGAGRVSLLIAAYESNSKPAIDLLLANGAKPLDRRYFLQQWNQFWEQSLSREGWWSTRYKFGSEWVKHQIEVGKSERGDDSEFWTAFCTASVLSGDGWNLQLLALHGIQPRFRYGLLGHWIAHLKSVNMKSQRAAELVLPAIEFFLDLDEVCLCTVKSGCQGLAPVELAAVAGYPQIVEHLLSRGASVPSSCSVREFMHTAKKLGSKRDQREGIIPLCVDVE